MRIESLEAEVGEMLDYWDPSLPLHLIRNVRVQVGEVLEECGLRPDAGLRLGVVWQSPGTTLRGRGSVGELSGVSGEQEVALDVQIDGGNLANRVHLETQLALAASGSPDSSIAPRRSGSILWRDMFTIRLEGSGSRFPVQWSDFRNAGWLPDEAGWYLEWDPDDLARPFLGGVLLFVNEAHERVRSAAAATRPTPVDRPVRDAMRWDVARSLILGALGNEEFVRGPQGFDDETVGRVILNLITAHFPGESVESLYNRWRTNPARFDCYLQDRLGLFHWA
jgi:hypothetical protein